MKNLKENKRHTILSAIIAGLLVAGYSVAFIFTKDIFLAALIFIVVSVAAVLSSVAIMSSKANKVSNEETSKLEEKQEETETNKKDREELLQLASSRKYITEQTITPGNQVLSDAIHKETLHEPVESYIDINPLKDESKSKATLYAFWGPTSYFFDNRMDLIDYLKNNDTSCGIACTFDYLDFFAGRTDVLKMINAKKEISYLTMIDEFSYEKYDHEKSIKCGEYYWEQQPGSLKSIYEAFNKRGIGIAENNLKRTRNNPNKE